MVPQGSITSVSSEPLLAETLVVSGRRFRYAFSFQPVFADWTGRVGAEPLVDTVGMEGTVPTGEGFAFFTGTKILKADAAPFGWRLSGSALVLA